RRRDDGRFRCARNWSAGIAAPRHAAGQLRGLSKMLRIVQYGNMSRRAGRIRWAWAVRRRSVAVPTPTEASQCGKMRVGGIDLPDRTTHRHTEEQMRWTGLFVFPLLWLLMSGCRDDLGHMEPTPTPTRIAEKPQVISASPDVVVESWEYLSPQSGKAPDSFPANDPDA